MLALVPPILGFAPFVAHNIYTYCITRRLSGQRIFDLLVPGRFCNGPHRTGTELRCERDGCRSASNFIFSDSIEARYSRSVRVHSDGRNERSNWEYRRL